MELALAQVEEKLANVLPLEERPPFLLSAMRDAVLGGGKRLRPRICIASTLACNGKVANAIPASLAIELLHSYTLVHDDLPAMDNDKERRGKPSIWAKYGEAVAILVGDALQARAFDEALNSPINARKIASTIAKAAIAVVNGQFEDLQENKAEPDWNYIRANKTAALFVAAATAGALAANADNETLTIIEKFAFEYGIAFQLVDDILDGDTQEDKSNLMVQVKEHLDSAKLVAPMLPGDATQLIKLVDELLMQVR